MFCHEVVPKKRTIAFLKAVIYIQRALYTKFVDVFWSATCFVWHHFTGIRSSIRLCSWDNALQKSWSIFTYIYEQNVNLRCFPDFAESLELLFKQGRLWSGQNPLQINILCKKRTVMFAVTESNDHRIGAMPWGQCFFSSKMALNWSTPVSIPWNW